MPYPSSHAYLTWGGPSCNGAENWQSGLRFANPVEPGTTDLEDVFTLIYGWLSDSPMGGSSLFRLSWVKLAVIGTNGRYPEGSEALLYETAPLALGSGPGLPPQCSLVVTTRTLIPRGRASRGRIYCPAPTFQVAADGRITQAQAEGVAVRTAQFLDDVTDLMGAPAGVFSDVGSGTYSPIETVEVGRVIDTQRRRRRSLDEARVSAPVNP